MSAPLFNIFGPLLGLKLELWPLTDCYCHKNQILRPTWGSNPQPWDEESHSLPTELARLKHAFSAGLKVRKRRIINEPTEGPETCPHLEEAVPCDDPACYSWQLVRLDPCVPHDEKACGPGTRFTHVKCVNSSGEFPQFTATSFHTWIWGKCRWTEMLKSLKRCSNWATRGQAQSSLILLFYDEMLRFYSHCRFHIYSI